MAGKTTERTVTLILRQRQFRLPRLGTYAVLLTHGRRFILVLILLWSVKLTLSNMGGWHVEVQIAV